MSHPSLASLLVRAAVALLVAIQLAACDVVADLMGQGVPPGGQAWVLTVENQSQQPAILFVAEYTIDDHMARVVGTASPSSVPALTSAEVRFGVPSGDTWGLFVNPGPNRETPILVAADLRTPADKRPFKIVVGADGRPGFVSP